LFDVSHNTCKVETHAVDGKRRNLFVHRKAQPERSDLITRACLRRCGRSVSRCSLVAAWGRARTFWWVR
jgi:RNA-splicing ligase RtcB